MHERFARAGARVRRLDEKVKRASGPGTVVDEWAQAVQRARERAVRGAGAWAAARVPAPVAIQLAQARIAAHRALTFAATEPTGIVGGALVLAGGGVLTRLLWTPLSWPASAINLLVATVTPTSCAMFGPRNFVSDNVCGTLLAVLTVTGALAAMAGLVLLRVPLRRLAMAVFGATLGPGRFLAAPLSAVVLFTVGWAGVQYHFPERPGIVPDGDFPALVGVMTYALARYGAAVRDRAGAVFESAASISIAARLGIVLSVPLVVSIVTIPIWHTPVRDQASVLASMVAAYVLFARRPIPRTGDER